MRIVQWNVLYEEDPERIIEYLGTLDADILCLQEILRGSDIHDGMNVDERIAERLGMRSFFAPAHTFEDGHIQGNAVLSHLPMSGTKTLQLCEATGDSGELQSRSCAAATVNTPDGPLRVLTAHVSFGRDLTDTESNAQEISRILEEVEAWEGPLILAGDFNLPPESQGIQRVLEHLDDLGPDLPTWTTRPFEYEGVTETQLRHRLDYMFGKNVEPRQSSLGDTEVSDHLPVIVDI